MIQNFKLIEKINLTHNVFKMIFEWESELEMKSWQFVTFLLEKIWGRAYSILELDWKKIVLIIKKRELNDWWRWWSKMICELNIWDSIKWVWPAGHFLLKENNKNKLFIWTGTWLVPLYNMIVSQLNNNKDVLVKFIFWVRSKEDIFYIEELEKLKKENPNFNYEVFISRVKDLHDFKISHINKKIQSGYVTNFLTPKNISNYKEIYLCGAPAMIEWTIEKLNKFNFKENENIFFEKY